MAVETQTEQMWKVYTPVAGYNGPTSGVVFRNGYAEVLDLEKARELQDDYGYRVEPVVPRPARPAMTRPAHPSEDVEPVRTYPFFPRDTTLPPGADPAVALPRQSVIVHPAPPESTDETENA